MADFLGLGVMFSGIDKGMNKSIDETVMGFNKISDTMNDVEKAGAGKQKKKGGIFSDVIEGMKLVSISRIGSALEDVHSTMVGTQRISTDFYNTLEEAGAKVRSAFDPSAAREFTNAMQLGMMTPEQLSQLSSGIMKFGVSSKEAAAVFPMMSDLVGKVGIDAGQVAQMFGQGLKTLRATPKQIKKLIKETAKMQKGFELTDQIDNLPAFFEIATKNAARFGKISADVTLRTVGSLSKLAMSFQKVGMSQDQAKNAAVGFADKLGNMQNALLDMQAGMEPTDDSIYKLQEALTLTGMSGVDAMDMITNNLSDPKALFSKMQGAISGLDTDTKNRVTQRLRRIFGDDITNMASAYGSDITKATAKADVRQETLGSADAEYKKLTNTLGGTLKKQEQLLSNAEEMFKVVKINRMRGTINKYISNQIEGWNNLSGVMGDNDSILGTMLEKLYILSDLGVLGFIDSSAVHTLGLLAGVLGSLFFPVVGLIGMFRILRGLGLGLGSTFIWLASRVMPGLVVKGDSVFDVFRAIGMHIKEKLWPAFKTFGRFLLKWASKSGAVFRVLGSFFMKWLVVPIMTGLSAVAGFFGTSVGVVVAVIAVLVAALVGLYVYWDEVVEGFDKGLKWLGKAFEDAWAFIERGIAAFQKDGFSGLLAFVFSEFTEFFEDIEKGVTNLFKWFDEAIDAFQAGGASGVWDFFLDSALTAFIAIGTKVRALFSDILNYAKDAFKGMDKYIPTWAGGSEAIDEPKTVPKKVDKTTEEPGFFSNVFGSDDEAKPDKPKIKAVPSMNQKGAPSESRRPLSIRMQEKNEVDDQNFQSLIDEVYDSKIVLAALLQELVKKSGSKVRITGDMKKLFKAVEDNNNSSAASSGINHAVNAG